MHLNHAGELSGILTAVCWTVAAMTFSVATRKAGALTVNLFRLIFAMMMYMVWSRLTRGLWFPSDASPDAWKWLSVSGFIGFVLGDYCLFSSYAYQPAKISMLVMSLAPPIATLFGVVLLHETITVQNFLGMALVLSGIAIVILKREEGEKLSSKFNYPVKGLLLALGGAAGQGIGAVFSKMGMQDYDPFASSQIRTITGIIGFTLLITITRNWKQTKDSLLQTGALKPLIAGSFFGPFLGVSLSLLAFQHTKVGIASTLIATVPVFILLPSVLFLGEKLNWKEVAGAFLAVAGMTVFFI